VEDAKRRAFVADLALVAVQVEIRNTVSICRDPTDNKILEAADIGRADCIVTGDRDLLVLGEFRGIPIVMPSDFLDMIARQI
jgi:putative PIN family toxin of toxin-antitoxin system